MAVVDPVMVSGGDSAEHEQQLASTLQEMMGSGYLDMLTTMQQIQVRPGQTTVSVRNIYCM